MNSPKSNNSQEANPLAKTEIGGLLTLEAKGNNRFSRISNSLSVGLSARKQPDLFDKMDAEMATAIKKSDKKHYVNRNGKPICLSVEQTKLTKYISSIIPFESEKVQKAIAILDTMNAEGKVNEDEEEQARVFVTISLIDACKSIIGTAKEKDIRTMGERLVALSQINHPQYFKTKTGECFMVAESLISIDKQLFQLYSAVRSIKGRKKKNTPDEEESILLGARIEIKPIFLYQAQNKYCPFHPDRYFQICKKNKTELFQELLSDLESKWTQHYIAYNKAESQYKKDNKELFQTNKEEYYKGLGLAKKEALIYKCNLATLKSRTNTDYESHRVYRAKYLKDIQKALASCIEYGIITDKSHVSKDKQNLILVYNANFKDTQIEEAEAEEI